MSDSSWASYCRARYWLNLLRLKVEPRRTLSIVIHMILLSQQPRFTCNNCLSIVIENVTVDSRLIVQIFKVKIKVVNENFCYNNWRLNLSACTYVYYIEISRLYSCNSISNEIDCLLESSRKYTMPIRCNTKSYDFSVPVSAKYSFFIIPYRVWDSSSLVNRCFQDQVFSRVFHPKKSRRHCMLEHKYCGVRIEQDNFWN